MVRCGRPVASRAADPRIVEDARKAASSQSPGEGWGLWIGMGCTGAGGPRGSLSTRSAAPPRWPTRAPASARCQVCGCTVCCLVLFGTGAGAVWRMTAVRLLLPRGSRVWTTAVQRWPPLRHQERANARQRSANSYWAAELSRGCSCPQRTKRTRVRYGAGNWWASAVTQRAALAPLPPHAGVIRVPMPVTPEPAPALRAATDSTRRSTSASTLQPASGAGQDLPRGPSARAGAAQVRQRAATAARSLSS